MWSSESLLRFSIHNTVSLCGPFGFLSLQGPARRDGAGSLSLDWCRALYAGFLFISFSITAFPLLSLYLYALPFPTFPCMFISFALSTVALRFLSMVHMVVSIPQRTFMRLQISDRDFLLAFNQWISFQELTSTSLHLFY